MRRTVSKIIRKAVTNNIIMKHEKSLHYLAYEYKRENHGTNQSPDYKIKVRTFYRPFNHYKRAKEAYLKNGYDGVIAYIKYANGFHAAVKNADDKKSFFSKLKTKFSSIIKSNKRPKYILQ